MSEFSADWLQLREAADARARAGHLLDALTESASESRAGDGSVQNQPFTAIVDLGAGTGANLRYLAPRLGPGQRWRCIDYDPALLSQLPERTAGWARQAGWQVEMGTDGLRLVGAGWNGLVCTEQRNLAIALQPQALQGQTLEGQTLLSHPAPLALPAGGLVTASALLDLVAEDWLASLVDGCQYAGCALLFALSYEGRVALTPARRADRVIIELVNQHQRGDKGFGSALGPTAPDVAERLLAAAGYRCWSANSDWRIGPEEPQLQKALIAGWLEAAIERAPQARPELLDWHQARRAQIDSGGLRIQVGHRDLIALPPGNRLRNRPIKRPGGR